MGRWRSRPWVNWTGWRGEDTDDRQAHTYETEELGPVEVTFSRWGTTDQLETKWRGEDCKGSYFWPDPANRERSRDGRDHASLLDSILAVEDEFQLRKRRDEIRKEAGKNPLPALLSPLAGGGRGQAKVPTHDRLEEVKVRGVDLRDGNALIIRADGTKDRVNGRHLLADIDAHDRLDLTRLYRAAIDAEAARVARGPLHVSANEVLPGILGLDPESEYDSLTIQVKIDFETCRRSAVYDGITFEADNAREVMERVTAHIVADEHPWTAGSRRFDEDGLRPTRETVVSPTSTALYRTEADYAEECALTDAVDTALAAAVKAEEEYLFDLSQFTGLNEEAARAAAQQPAEQAEADEVTAAIDKSIRAPESAGDWED